MKQSSVNTSDSLMQPFYSADCSVPAGHCNHLHDKEELSSDTLSEDWLFDIEYSGTLIGTKSLLMVVFRRATTIIFMLKRNLVPTR
mgnify:CR=1 FL=1